jgi:hypothetical protein
MPGLHPWSFLACVTHLRCMPRRRQDLSVEDKLDGNITTAYKVTTLACFYGEPRRCEIL